jgi:hypothetical protein
MLNNHIMRIQVLTAARMNKRAFWDIAPCSLGVDRRFRDESCRQHQGDLSPG